MNKLPHTSAILTYTTGDGFKTYVLPRLVNKRDLFITTKYNTNTGSAQVTTLHSLHKVDPDSFDRIIIDIHLPRYKSKALNTLREAAAGKVLILINAPHDVKAISSAVNVFSNTRIDKKWGLYIRDYHPSSCHHRWGL